MLKITGNSPEKTDNGLVQIENVSKRFRKHTLSKRGYSTLKSRLLAKIFRREAAPDRSYLQVLKNLSVKIESGKSVGIIGHNGSGKSTLLKLISGIYRPDSGRIVKHGRISALIELGAGFHPDFTGRENIYLGGVMYGLTRKEIDEKYNDIVAYAELEDFIDDPVRTYSSGMYMRLGFSLAVHTDPDILLVDEVLAVGDASFIHRCHDTISYFRRSGKTIILVTHDLASVVRWCDEAIWLDGGVIKKQGEPKLVVDSYMQYVQRQEEHNFLESQETIDAVTGKDEHRWGNGDVKLRAVRIKDAQGNEKHVFSPEEGLQLEVDYQVNKQLEDLVFGVGIVRADGICVHGTNTEIAEIKLPEQKLQAGQGTYTYKIKRLGLVSDSYYLDVAAHKKDSTPYDYHHMLYKFSVRSERGDIGVFSPDYSWEIK
ncbi:MAG: ABC transporter ATP-binding protein [Deltaproteobacteria bacterium]|nr:ABC transporter ATP-binding protein [Deltaproteobacteria bacterium]